MSLKKQLSSLLAAFMIVAAPTAALLAAPAAQAQEQSGQSEQSEPSASVASSAAAAPSAMIEKEVVDNPYGLDALWKQGDLVARGTLMILLIMSLGS